MVTAVYHWATLGVSEAEDGLSVTRAEALPLTNSSGGGPFCFPWFIHLQDRGVNSKMQELYMQLGEIDDLQVAPRSTKELLKAYVRPLIRNAWYCAAWSSDISDALFHRRILDTPILLYRKQNGEVCALLDMCPHKLAPMHLGDRIGDDLQCKYHGLRFDSNGQCVHNAQGNGRIPPQARLATFPIIERDGVVWIWPGDADKVDESTLPDLPHLSDPGLRTVKGGHHVASNYMLLVENLLDLGHALFLHKSTGGVADNMPLAESRILQEQGRVSDLRRYNNVEIPGVFAPYLDKASKIVDYRQDIHWMAPSTLVAVNDYLAPDNGHGDAIPTLRAAHLITPESQNSMHYFYAHSRNYALDDDAADEAFRDWHRDGLDKEDSAMAAAIQLLLPDAVLQRVDMVMLSTDVAALRVNRILDLMAAAEA